MSRQIVTYETSVTAPDGYRERACEYIYFCDVCHKDVEISHTELDECESCLLIREAAPELLEVLKELSEAIDYGRDHTPRDFQRFLYGQPGSGFTHAAIRKACAAIAKATGK